MGRFSRKKNGAREDEANRPRPDPSRPNPGIFENGAHKHNGPRPRPDPSRPNPGIFEKRSEAR